MRLILSWVVLLAVPWMGEAAARDTALAAKLLPEPRELVMGDGALALAGRTLAADLPVGPEHEACRAVLCSAVQRAGGSLAAGPPVDGCTFRLGKGAPLPELPTEGIVGEAYVLAVTSDGVAAHAASPIGLLWAAETLMQLARIGAVEGTIPAVTVRDSPEFRLRGIYIEGGQERFGRIVRPDYLKAQVRRLASLKMNTLVVEAYNLFPYASFPACADSGSLSVEDCRGIFAEARKWHVTLVPSLQTLAQAHELVWTKAAGERYREATAPGLVCPSNPEVYPFIKGLYRDLLAWFADAPLIGIGCSEIDMQWQSRYCPKSKARVEKGEYQREFLRAYVRHTYDTRSEAANEAVATAWERLDAVKSRQELANQALHDVVGVVDTQEAGYIGNSDRTASRGSGGPRAGVVERRQRKGAGRRTVHVGGHGAVGDPGRSADHEWRHGDVGARRLGQAERCAEPEGLPARRSPTVGRGVRPHAAHDRPRQPARRRRRPAHRHFVPVRDGVLGQALLRSYPIEQETAGRLDRSQPGVAAALRQPGNHGR